MIQQSFIKKQNAFGLFTPINESMNLTYGVSYQDDHHKMSGPIYTSKHMDKKKMSKNDLSQRQMDERTDYFKSKIDNLS